MKYIVIIIVIAVYWFLLATTLSFVSQDTYLSGMTLGDSTNTSYSSYDYDQNTNYSSSADASTSPKSVLDMTIRMFTFRLPSYLPSSLNVFINFINWIMIILLGVSIYRLVNPLA